MNRRSVIKKLVIVAGGMFLLPACLEDRKNGSSSIKLNTISLNAEDEELLAEVAESLIPATDTPGAKALKLHLFVMKMLDDCYDKGSQNKFIAGIRTLNEFTENKYKQSFIKLNTAQKHELLFSIENDQMPDQNVKHFFRIMKSRTVQGYINSQYVMTKLIKYELVPGRYNGFYKIKA